MKISLLILVFLVGLSCSSTKSLSITNNPFAIKETIDIVRFKFNLEIDSIEICDFYLQDGITMQFSTNESTKLKSTLPYKYQDYSFDYIELNSETFPHKRCDILLIAESKAYQTNQNKKDLLNQLREEYNLYKGTENDRRCIECKVVLVNGVSKFPYQTREILNSLAVKDIRYIKIYDKPMNSIVYGDQGKRNGLIEIETNKASM